MKAYLVGGAVRDEILGRSVKDRDWVVVGATPTQMLAEGYQQVGADFPVFLHPTTNEEYALARVERKSGAGYHGFTVSTENVSLEDDLSRRDLTINSIAKDAETGSYIDPHGGIEDIKKKILRHTSDAFAEDPLRVIRLARFAARYSDFSIAPETMELARKMVRDGQLNELPVERFWTELQKATVEFDFWIFVDVLFELEANKHVNFFKQLWGNQTKQDIVSYAVSSTASTDPFNHFVAVTAFTTDRLTSLKASNDIVKLRELIYRWRHVATAWQVYEVIKLARGYNTSRDMQKLLQLIPVSVNSGYPHLFSTTELMLAWNESRKIVADMLDPALKGKEIGEKLEELRSNKVTIALQKLYRP